MLKGKLCDDAPLPARVFRNLYEMLVIGERREAEAVRLAQKPGGRPGRSGLPESRRLAFFHRVFRIRARRKKDAVRTQVTTRVDVQLSVDILGQVVEAID